VGPLRTQMFHSCLDSVEVIVAGSCSVQGKDLLRPQVARESDSRRSTKQGSSHRGQRRRKIRNSLRPQGAQSKALSTRPHCPLTRPPSLLRLRAAACAFRPLNRFLRFVPISGPCGRIFKVVSYSFRGIVEHAQLFQTHGQPNRRHRVVFFVAQRLPITVFRRSVISALEIKNAPPRYFSQLLMWSKGMEFR